MSLTLHLNNLSDPICIFLLNTLPQPDEWKLSSGEKLALVLPPNEKLPKRANTIVGGGFDAYARILLAKHYGLSANELCSSFIAANAQIAFPSWYRPLAKEALKSLRASFAQEDKSKDWVSIACLLGRGDLLYHSGFRADSSMFEFDCHYEDPLVLFEVLRLGSLFEKTFFSRFPKGEHVTLNPVFDPYGWIDGADGDLLIDGTLVDFKTGAAFSPRLIEKEKAQLWGYVLLENAVALEEKRPSEIDHCLSLYFARAGAFLSLDLSFLGQAYIQRCAEKFRELLKKTSSD